MMLIFLILIISSVEIVRATQNDNHPKNTAVIAGNPMLMTCQSSSSGTVQWTFKYPNKYGETTLFNGSFATRGFSVAETLSKKTVILSKDRIQLTDAGIYTCIRDAEQNVGLFLHSAELVVLTGEPDCGTTMNATNVDTMDDIVVRMWCRISYVGNLFPVMSWFRSDANEFRLHDDSYTTQESGKTVSSATIKTTLHNVSLSLNVSNHGIILGCVCYFNALNEDEIKQAGPVTKARNPTEYVFRWNFTVKFYYGPRNISIAPLKLSYEYGDNLRCHADGNPPPTYKWIAIGNPELKEGATFTVDKSLNVGELHSLTCIATSPVSGDKISKAVNITVLASSGSSNSVYQPKSLLLAVLLPTVGVIILLNFGLILQKRFFGRNIQVNVKYENTEQVYEDADQTVTSSTPSETSNYEPVSMVNENTVNDETMEEVEHPVNPSYSNLTGVRTPPTPVIYSELEKDTSSPNTFETHSGSEMAHYVNVGNI